MSFPRFTSFPPEILSLILESCPPNDLTCLRLTCKTMYNLSPTKEIIPLQNTDLGPFCSEDESLSRWAHRMACHKASYEAVCKRNAELGRSTPEMKKRCRTKWSSNHCECYTRHTRLHRRIKSWMPRNMHYCGKCDIFTERKKQHNGRCYHGQPKKRRSEGHYWTHTSRGGAFGRKIWKKWFNNRAMNRLEARMRQDLENQRKGCERYSMRKLEPKAVNSQGARDSKAFI